MNINKIYPLVINPLHPEHGELDTEEFFIKAKYLSSEAKIIRSSLIEPYLPLEILIRFLNCSNQRFIDAMKELEYFGWIKKSRGKHIRLVYYQEFHSPVSKQERKNFYKSILPTFELTAIKEKYILEAAANMPEEENREELNKLFNYYIYQNKELGF